MSSRALELDCVIFGGGAAGLFTLDRVRSLGYSALVLEHATLGAGQTRCAQGIIHGGTKYSLAGLLGADSRAIAAMPERWIRMAEAQATPNLAAAQLRSRHCWLWRSDGFAGRLGMLGAKLALRVRPEEVDPAQRPEPLRNARGAVLRLAEPIFDPSSVLAAIASQHHGFVAHYHGPSLEVRRLQDPVELRVQISDSGAATQSLEINAQTVILAAGIGNEQLRERFQCPPGQTQRRPLHQALVRSPSLPWFDGHCVDGDATRVTITSARDDKGNTVWQLGGRLAEEGVALTREAQLAQAATELRAILPDASFEDAEWSAYRVDRAEPLDRGRRPDDARLLIDGRVISLWPTKLALAPRAAELAADALRSLGNPRGSAGASLGIEFTLPAAAPPPWHDAQEWTRLP